ncbi:N-acetyltransferase [Corynebacterium godavarianum]|uniref:N-acetyltransferase n=1 Tax=Corynebacterium godavarianum TaxID=2054421 RepID=A0ABY3E083_9CORY|nr:GNAT family N-acetyltransferase [Corynebacterium godavarianum]MBL7286592.1 N-acetyltransferase [Corynebacterium godavarianum]TSJ73012.1 N-acetyltransferase [Corynebacterium godavarianum]
MPETSQANVELSKNEDKSQYEIHVDGELAGFATYKDSGSARELPHTVVDPKFRGEGLSKPLIKFALDDVRGDNLSVVPSCPAVARYIVQNPEYKDLVE